MSVSRIDAAAGHDIPDVLARCSDALEITREIGCLEESSGRAAWARTQDKSSSSSTPSPQRPLLLVELGHAHYHRGPRLETSGMFFRLNLGFAMYEF
jgi:hypothetical protein